MNRTSLVKFTELVKKIINNLFAKISITIAMQVGFFLNKQNLSNPIYHNSAVFTITFRYVTQFPSLQIICCVAPWLVFLRPRVPAVVLSPLQTGKYWREALVSMGVLTVPGLAGNPRLCDIDCAIVPLARSLVTLIYNTRKNTGNNSKCSKK